MQRTDARATAGVEDWVRTFVRVVALNIDKRQLDTPALRMMTILRYDQKPAPTFVEVVGLVDTITRFDSRNIVLLCIRGTRRNEEQTKEKRVDHYASTYFLEKMGDR